MSTGIPIFKKFGVCLTVMSYFGHTHQSFLLLSYLNRESREKLDENYEAFLNGLMPNLAQNDYKKGQEKNIDLPCDLFKFNLMLNTEADIVSFLRVVDNIHNKKGYYFNQHYMHTRLYSELAWIVVEFVDKLYPHLDSLKDIEIVEFIQSIKLIEYI